MGKKIKLTKLVGKSGFRADVTGNIYRAPFRMIREVTSVKWEKYEGRRWLFWRWKKEPQDGFSCGYSGIREDSPSLSEVTLEVFGLKTGSAT